VTFLGRGRRGHVPARHKKRGYRDKRQDGSTHRQSSVARTRDGGQAATKGWASRRQSGETIGGCPRDDSHPEHGPCRRERQGSCMCSPWRSARWWCPGCSHVVTCSHQLPIFFLSALEPLLRERIRSRWLHVAT
jgi:hypothetical protein